MKIITGEQRSKAWFEARIGCITASNAHRIMNPAASKTYINELVAESVSGCYNQTFQTAAMKWGVDHEQEALDLYARDAKSARYRQIGFALHSDYDKVGASLDALSTDRVIEVKCPYNPGEHICHLLGEIDKKYILQMQFQMWVAEKDLCDFVSYDPRLDAKYKIHIQKIERDDEVIEKIKGKVETVLDSIDRIMLRLSEL